MSLLDDMMLSKDQLAKLKEHEQKLLEMSPVFDRMDDCGIPCQDLRQYQQDGLQTISKLRQNFTNRKRPGG